MSKTASRFPTIRELGPHGGIAIARQLETVFRAVIRGPAVTNTREFFRYVTNEPHLFGNFVIVSDPSSLNDTDAAIEPLLSLNVPTAILFPGDVSRDVEAMIQDRGYGLAESMPEMAVDIDALAPAALPDGYRFSRITSPKTDQAWCKAFAAGYGIPRRVADDFGPRTADNQVRAGAVQYFGITKDDTIVSTSMLYLDGAVAGVYCVSTMPDHRGKGLAAFATAQPLREVRSLGYQTGILQSSAMGEMVYRRLGFQVFGAMPLYVRSPDGRSAAH